MTFCVSESENGVRVEMTVEVSSASLQQLLPNPSSELQTDESPSVLVGQAMDRVHNQLPPLLRRVRLLTEASLVEMVSCAMKDSIKT